MRGCASAYTPTIDCLVFARMQAGSTLLRAAGLARLRILAPSSCALISARCWAHRPETALFGLAQAQSGLFWPAIGVATLGNTLGGMLTGGWLRGAQGRGQVTQSRLTPESARLPAGAGPKAACVAWLRSSAIRCAPWGLAAPAVLALRGYMLIGKFLRYLCMTAVLLCGVSRTAHAATRREQRRLRIPYCSPRRCS